MEHYRLPEAAKLLNVSYQTLKLWIYNGKIRSVKTPGGHHRIARSEVERLIGTKKMPPGKTPPELEIISGRNKLLGTVTEVRRSGLLAQVTIDIGGQLITSIITRDAAEALGLKKGVAAYALVKATEVMVIRA